MDNLKTCNLLGNDTEEEDTLQKKRVVKSHGEV